MIMRMSRYGVLALTAMAIAAVSVGASAAVPIDPGRLAAPSISNTSRISTSQAPDRLATTPYVLRAIAPAAAPAMLGDRPADGLSISTSTNVDHDQSTNARSIPSAFTGRAGPS